MSPLPHLHYHSCEICGFNIAYRKPGEKGLKMCPCREAFYCGPEHQKVHWPIHKSTCYYRYHKSPTTAMDAAVASIIQFWDTVVVEIAVLALIKEDVNVDLKQALEKSAIVLKVEQEEGAEDMETAYAAGRTPPFVLSRETSVVSIEGEAKERGLGQPFFENPMDRELRLKREQLGVVIIFQPTGRAITKRVPSIQLGMWDMIREKEKTTTNPPMVYWNIHMANMRFKMERQAEGK